MTRSVKAATRATAQLWLLAFVACGTTQAQRSPTVPARPTPAASDSSGVPNLTDTEIEMLGGAANATGARLGDLQHLIFEFAVENGNLPENLDEAIDAEVRRSVGIRVDISTLRQDLWGRQIRYHQSPPTFELRSRGADSEFGTADDIVVIGRQGREKPCIARVGSREIRFADDAQPCTGIVH